MGNASKTIRIGVDVGGTNTDSVILDDSARSSSNRGVIAHFKTATTPNVTDGIETAVRTVLERSAIPHDRIACLTIGTTHFINAVVEHDARRLSKVAVIRLSKSFTREVPPFSDFPPALKEIMYGYHGYVDGGLHIDGSQESPIVEAQVIRECEKIKEKGIRSVVIAGVYAPIDDHFQQESQVRKIMKRELPSADIVCSHEISNIGFLERENASILNASILRFARRTIRGFRAAMKRLNLRCGLYLTQNDGTLVDAASAARLPIRTFSSGATNSMRGAAYLGGLDTGEKGGRTSTIVVDIGGTTSDVGVLLPSGFPRQASAYVTVAGVRINYSMPHLESIGLGGGSIVRELPGGQITVGSDSVGHFLTTDAKVFGGSTLTATDITVAAGAKIGDPSLVKDVPPSLVSAAQAKIKSLLEGIIDVMKTSPEPLPVLLVGGGSVIAPNTLEGVSQLIRPPFHDVANAVGAAISKVGGSVDLIQSTVDQTVAQAVEKAKTMAIDRAVEAGADRNTVEVAEIDTIPLQYVANQVRIIVKAIGDLASGAGDLHSVNGIAEEDEPEVDEREQEGVKARVREVPSAALNIDAYRPRIVTSKETGIPEWYVSEVDIGWLADGCYVLGCAGGGSPFPEFIQLRDQLRAGHTLRVIDSSHLSPDANIYWGGHMGSPAVSVERLAANETIDAIRELMDYLRHDSFDAVMGLEIGGANGLQPLLLGSSKHFDRPVIDADWMGRAYPTYWQTTLCVYETGQLVPCAIASGDGKHIIMTKTTDDEIVDRALRASCAEMGSRVGMAARPTTTDRVRNYGVLNTVSLAWRIGRCIARAHAKNTLNTVAEQIVDEIGGPSTARVLFRGKIISVERRLFKGHSYGEITIQQLPTDEEENTSASPSRYQPVATGGFLKIPFKNENIYAKHILESGEEKYIAMVPDLISVLDTQSGKALGVPEFRYGLRVTVLGITCSPRWSDTEKGLQIGGPRAFGYDIDYVPLGAYIEPRSVILEYA
ncbi:hypothetical protein GLOTRDRAFT_82362 [Gloeophyllum trabeum ATCC 11539]|uniref:Hydantoinase/oxoprolinase n=1 Tax=Gloeophyllum trabeum (strain ATCC 11539 / FP-39264 / Madison 617) TaxID=670483 RepID=S7PSU3_GLOTA|nr:uncharacterized protein GLOTRDRAFT_82362 [Gloeophyllum trabeum ATCC 11539]EPQ50447.1 hypothetical protein GLOTRDRAFT_82362 [Gloeophyllum trabeum ATCC 11539]